MRAKRTPVFVYFTADWCLTCKVNEKAVIETQGVRDAFARNKVAVLLGTEGAGLSPRWAAEASLRARIPMTAGIDSLNVAAAAAIACFALAARAPSPS